jgi:hypothetical protein
MLVHHLGRWHHKRSRHLTWCVRKLTAVADKFVQFARVSGLYSNSCVVLRLVYENTRFVKRAILSEDQHTEWWVTSVWLFIVTYCKINSWWLLADYTAPHPRRQYSSKCIYINRWGNGGKWLKTYLKTIFSKHSTVEIPKIGVPAHFSYSIKRPLVCCIQMKVLAITVLCEG